MIFASKQERARVVARILSRTRAGEGGCRIWTGAYTGHGYPQFWFDGARRTRRWIFSALKNRRPAPALSVTTTCGHRGCVAHLAASQHAAIMRKRVTAKSAATRMRIAMAVRTRSKLSMEQVRQLRARAAAGEKPAHLAREVGISRRNVSRMLRGETWRDYAQPLAL
jgi:hypothetical protein